MRCIANHITTSTTTTTSAVALFDSLLQHKQCNISNYIKKECTSGTQMIYLFHHKEIVESSFVYSTEESWYYQVLTLSEEKINSRWLTTLWRTRRWSFLNQHFNSSGKNGTVPSDITLLNFVHCVHSVKALYVVCHQGRNSVMFLCNRYFAIESHSILKKKNGNIAEEINFQ